MKDVKNHVQWRNLSFFTRIATSRQVTPRASKKSGLKALDKKQEPTEKALSTL